MKNKPSLTIAIPAYNEEKNICRLLDALVIQTKKNYKLDGIFIYSDGSTDNTVSLVKQRRFNRVTIYDFNKNLGKNKRVNQIMKNNKSDILIQVDADMIIKKKNVIDELVKAIMHDSQIGLACSYHKAVKPQSFIGKLSYFGFEIWDKSRQKLGSSGLRYYCEGGMRAFSLKFTKQFRLPVDKHIGEDSYSFYYAIAHGYKVTVAMRAVVYLELPENIHDYVKQMKRFLKDPSMVGATFKHQAVKKYETMNTRIKLKVLAGMLVRSPFIGVCYLTLQIMTKILTNGYIPDKKWVPIERT